MIKQQITKIYTNKGLIKKCPYCNKILKYNIPSFIYANKKRNKIFSCELCLCNKAQKEKEKENKILKVFNEGLK